MEHDQLWALACARDVKQLLIALESWLKRWAGDILRPAGFGRNYTYRDDLCSAATEKLLGWFPLNLRDGRFQSGKHFLNALRRVAKKEMKGELRRQSLVPLPKPETIRRRVDLGKPLHKPWECQHRVPLPDGNGNDDKLSHCERRIDPRFYSRDDSSSNDYLEFAKEITRKALERSKERGWHLEGLLEMGVPELAKATETPERTIRDQCRQIGREIASKANPELRDDGKEFLQKRWEAAAENRPRGLKTKGGTAPTDGKPDPTPNEP